MMAPVRTRYAPSPTGEPHIGNIRTTVFEWLFARHHGGAFFVRIEDTDQERYVPGSTRRIFESLAWLGLNLDEGPDHATLRAMKADEDWPGAPDYGGDFGPYVQSQRLPLYQQWAEWLVEHGFAYRANETPDELDRMRKATEGRREALVFREEMRLRADVRPDEPHVIRMRVVPRDGVTRFHDLIKGDVAFENAHVDDQVLLKADGFPTYHLAVVVDDHLQGVTHVLRGDDWLSSAPKHVLLYQYFGWEPPQFAHLPNVLGTDGKKLSKRHGATSVTEFRNQGYLPEALINFLAMLGWAPGEGVEQNVFTVPELIAQFQLERVGSSPAVFSYDKLDWLNGVHIRRLETGDLADRLAPFLEQAGLPIDTPDKRARLRQVTPLIQERMKTLKDAAPLVDFFFQDIALPPRDSLIGPKMEQHLSLYALKECRRALEEAPAFDAEALEKALRELAAALQLKPAQLFTIVRNAVANKPVTPPLFGTLSVLGRATTVERLSRAIGVLGG
jgi:glutamyl-tRNA synthetase